MTSRYDRIRQILVTTFRPSHLEIVDESAKHANHAKHTGVSTDGETHYRVVMVSENFADKSRLARSRAVHEALAGEFTTGLHALSLVLNSTGEAKP
jgi:BolA protein